MKRINILWIAVISTILWGCYEDKGNYNYEELNTPVIPNLEYPNNMFYITDGDSLYISPEISYKITQNPDVTYEWTLNKEVISTETELKIDAYKGKLGFLRGSFNITDKSTGIKYFNSFTLTVSSKYQEGWLILTDNGGKSNLSFIRETSEVKNGKEVITFKMENNINPEGYGRTPIKLIEHWTDNSSTLGEIMVMHKESDGVELDGNSLAQVVTTKQEFINETYPENFKPKDALYLLWNSYIQTEDGVVYNRRAIDVKGYQTGVYLTLPVSANGGFKVEKIIPSRYVKSYQGLVYEVSNNHRRYMMITDESSYSPEYAGLILPLIYTKYPNDSYSHFDDLGDMVLRHGGFFNGSYGSSGYFTLLQSDSDNKYYMQEFVLGSSYGRASVSSFNYQTVFPGSDLIKEDSKMLVCPNNSRVFFTSENKLYHVDRALKENMIVREYTNPGFTSKITALFYHKYEDRIMVGLENGEVYILNTSVEALSQGGRVLYPTELQGGYPADAKLGKIVDLIYKYGKKGVFENPSW